MKEQKHAKLIGRIIFANLLEYPLEKYKLFMEEAETSLLFEKHRFTRTRFTTLTDTDCLSKSEVKYSSNVVAEVIKKGNDFFIRYTHECYNKVYLVELFDSLGHKLRRISSRNQLTHRIIQGIIEHQKKFLTTGSSIDLVTFSQVELVKWINKSPHHGTRYDISWVSRLVNRLSVIIPSGEERMLKSFFQTQKDINKHLIKQLLDKENEYLESGRIKVPCTDDKIRIKLENEYGLKISRHSVGHCRKDMGIPSFKRRLSGYKYPPLSVNFSIIYPLVLGEVLKYAPENPGIYEFRLKNKEIEYPNGKTKVIYIGSTRNIKKRLREHLSKNSKNSHIKDSLKKYGCSFRYIQVPKKWKSEEKRLYNLFFTTYGASPRCNRVRP